ncbi:hypothetical protein TNCV_4102451 [Trichonephila clavipes]|nr:hypothetical protein TNCV_4102451 [Trichonephila clavipes]
MYAVWPENHVFTAAFTSSLSQKLFPPRLLLRNRKMWKSLGARLGLYGALSKTSQSKDLIKCRVVRGEALRYCGGAKHFLRTWRAVYFTMLFGVPIELHSRHLS